MTQPFLHAFQTMYITTVLLSLHHYCIFMITSRFIYKIGVFSHSSLKVILKKKQLNVNVFLNLTQL